MVYKKILIPVDGSPTSTAGLNEALRLAKHQKAREMVENATSRVWGTHARRG